VNRSEIWTVAAGPDFSGKPRPAVIVQAEEFDTVDSVTVCPITSVLREADILRPPIESSQESGLDRPSQLMIDKITTIPRRKFGQRIGTLSPGDMASLERSLLLFFGLTEPSV